jgi:hypothetical protein
MTSLVVASRSEHPGVKAFLAALHDEKTRARIEAIGMTPSVP